MIAEQYELTDLTGDDLAKILYVLPMLWARYTAEKEKRDPGSAFYNHLATLEAETEALYRKVYRTLHQREPQIEKA